jgi:hypothetical protein
MNNYQFKAPVKKIPKGMTFEMIETPFVDGTNFIIRYKDKVVQRNIDIARIMRICRLIGGQYDENKAWIEVDKIVCEMIDELLIQGVDDVTTSSSSSPIDGAGDNS